MSLQSVIDEIAASVAPLVGQGKVADYIPALACIDPDQFGIAIHTKEGQTRWRFAPGRLHWGSLEILLSQPKPCVFSQNAQGCQFSECS